MSRTYGVLTLPVPVTGDVNPSVYRNFCPPTDIREEMEVGGFISSWDVKGVTFKIIVVLQTRVWSLENKKENMTCSRITKTES